MSCRIWNFIFGTNIGDYKFRLLLAVIMSTILVAVCHEMLFYT